MNLEEEQYLAHYGIIRRSGRYPWGSGGAEIGYRDFLGQVDDLRKQGFSEADIAKGFGISTTQLRVRNSIAKNEQKQSNIDTAWRLKNTGMGNVAIGKEMGLPESSVRALLKPGEKDKADRIQTTAQMLKDAVDKKGYIDVGSNVHLHNGVSDTTFKNAVASAREDGYTHHYVALPQLGTNKETTLKVLAGPGVTGKEVWANRDKITQITDFSEDGGRSFFGILPPISVNAKRVEVNYKEQGGDRLDGVIYVRPGVADVSLGKSRYAQVRVAVNDTHYLKGMAMYKDGLPDGVDLVFNTNKSSTGNKLDAMKPMKNDPDNPFGSVVRQIVVRDSGESFVTGYGKNRFDGTERVTSAMNLVHEEGNWSDWSDTLSSQVLSKQSPRLAKTQLDMTYEQKTAEFARIKELTNPVVKKKLLEQLADDADSSSAHLKAAALKDQATHVILPISSMPPSQVYAPNYLDGTRVVLIRFPHGGTFEIPELTVNNNQPEAKRLLGDARDAIGIHHTVAERLSGADFDGDTVLVIPNDGPANKRIKTTAALEQLQGFDPKSAYPAYEGMPKMTTKMKGQQMGQVSNLITDMTLAGASRPELARAIKHSMVVIDAEKWNLNYKASAIQNGIPALKEKYQGGPRGGASTLVSRASAELRVPDLKPRAAQDGGPVDKTTGAKVYAPDSAQKYVDKKGNEVEKTRMSVKLAETNDARSLLSTTPTPIERVYAEHSNKLKNLADEIRLETINTPNIQRSPAAAKVYKAEVDSLTARLRIAERNAPLERQAQIFGNHIVRQKRAVYPDMDAETLKKVKGQALQEGRNRFGAGKERIVLTRNEWDAIQAGAISNSMLRDIINNADIDRVREFATPKVKKLVGSTEIARAKAMFDKGYTRAEVASALGVSLTTLDTAVTGSEA